MTSTVYDKVGESKELRCNRTYQILYMPTQSGSPGQEGRVERSNFFHLLGGNSGLLGLLNSFYATRTWMAIVLLDQARVLHGNEEVLSGYESPIFGRVCGGASITAGTYITGSSPTPIPSHLRYTSLALGRMPLPSIMLWVAHCE